MNHDTKEYIVFSLFLAVFFVALVVGALLLDSLSCSSRWKYSGLESSSGPLQGCLVHLPDGRWIPDDRYREIEND